MKTLFIIIALMFAGSVRLALPRNAPLKSELRQSTSSPLFREVSIWSTATQAASRKSCTISY
jgi:hypothetical protein